MTLDLATLFMLSLAVQSLAMELEQKDPCNLCNPSNAATKSHSLDEFPDKDCDAERTAPLAININNYGLSDFPCDEAYDAERGTLCALCSDVLGVGSHIGKIEYDPPLYFHYRCLKENPPCLTCLNKLNKKITWKSRIKTFKKSSSECLCTSFKCLAATAGTALALYIVYYFSMGPGGTHYCPCLNSDSIDSCREDYPGCNFNLF